MIKILQILSLFFFAIWTVEAQGQNIVSGKVMSGDDGEPLPGVNILIEGTTQGTITDINGNYSVEVGGGEVLVFSFIGYTSVKEEVNGRGTINVTLQSDVNQLDEVVVIGYGSVRKSDLTGAVSSIKGQELTTVPAVNPMEALQGKVAGVQITNSSGVPGSAPVVRIRGIGTSGDPSPIYVVDGVILNDISFLNSSDIASVEILKDASALAIYGNRGANGVIIITTKLGTVEEGTRITMSSEYSLQVQQNRLDLLNGRQFAEVINAMSPGTYNNLEAVPNTDWQDLIFQTGEIQNHQLAISGASEKNQYYFSLGYYNQKGTIPESSYERVTIKINDKLKPKSYFSLGTNLTISPYTRDNTKNDAPFNAYRASPVITPYDANGNYNEVIGVGNILADFEYTTDNVTHGIASVGQIYAEAYFLNGFTFKSSFGTEVLFEENKAFVPEFYVSSAQQNEENYYSRNNFRRISWMWENTLNYDKEIGQSRINAVVGYTLQEVKNEQLNLTGRGLFRTGDDFRYLDQSNLDPSSVTNGIRDSRDFFNQISYLGRFNYSYANRYIATLTFRRDGSSKFLKDNRYGDFPAVALGWNVINEEFISFPSFFSNLKVRGSWGRMGNDKIKYLAAYNTVGNNFNAVFGTDEQLYFGQSDSEFGNPALQWEGVEQYNIGLELGFLNDKLTSEIDFWNRDTKQILIGLQLPGYLGNGTNQVIFNAGQARNRGLDINIKWQDEVGDFSYNAGIVGSVIHNEMLKVSGVEGSDELPSPTVGNNVVTLTKAGLPIGAFYGYIVDGVFQNEGQITSTPSLTNTKPGDLIFRDVNGDGQLNGDDRTNIGSSIPDFTYGIDLGIAYKNISLSLLFQGQNGNEIYNIKETIRPTQYNYESHVRNYWRGEGTSNAEPRPTAGGNNFLPSTRFIQDGAFFRLRTVMLSYDFSYSLLNRVKINSARIYLRGNNVFTITDFTGYSPEVADGNPLLNGVDRGTYPIASIYSLGLNLTF